MHPVLRSSKTLDVSCRFGRPESSFPSVPQFKARPTQIGNIPHLKLGRGWKLCLLQTPSHKQLVCLCDKARWR
jgi:hypothetical protein